MSAIHNAAEVMQTVVVSAEQFGAGQEPDLLIYHKAWPDRRTLMSRLDGPLKVKGAARFAAEFPVEGMAYAALAYCTIAKGRIATLDTTAAEAAPGVVLVMTHRNAPRMKAPGAL